MSLTGKVAVLGSLAESVSADLAPAAQAIGPELFAWVVASGVGVDQADKIWHDTRNLGASAAESLDLNGGLTGSFGAVVFAKLKAIIVVALPTNANDVQVTQPAANGVPFMLAAGDGFAIKPGSAMVLLNKGAGWTVTAGTGDLITVTTSAGGTGVDYTIVLIGTSA